MRLSAYLEARNERVYLFANRARTDPKAAYEFLRAERVPTLEILERWVAASRREPAPDGGTVTLDDLAAEARELREGAA